MHSSFARNALQKCYHGSKRFEDIKGIVQTSYARRSMMCVQRNSRVAYFALVLFGFSGTSFAGDWLSGTYLDPALQRQDIFSHKLWNSIPEYRAVYNRPRYVSGYLAYKIEPSSQEAMAWQTNYCNGNYANHRGPYVAQYNYPKPWEALKTVARPDFQKPTDK